MTPAIEFVRRAGVPFEVHEYQHDASARSFGLEAADALGIEQAKVFKTLVASLASGELVVAVIPVAAQLDLKVLASTAGAKRACMAEPGEAQRSTGYVLGGISPLGQKRRLSTYIDDSAPEHGQVFVSAGRRGLEIALDPKDLVALTDATLAPISKTTSNQ